MKRNILFALILILAFILRFYHLGENPPSLDWDEAALGYNAYSILKTAKDEYGNFLPLSFRSFGDFKPPMYVYLTTIPVGILGLTEYAVRLPSAMAGIGAVFISYFLIGTLLGRGKRKITLLAVFLFAVSPWHIQFSRAAFEANVSLTFFLAGLLYFIRSLEDIGKLLPSLILFVLSMYTYHSARLIVPVFVLGAVIMHHKIFLPHIRRTILYGFISLLLVLPIFIGGNASSARFGSVGIFNPNEQLEESINKINYDKGSGDIPGALTHNRRFVYGREILSGYVNHFNFNFLFLNGDLTGRHHAADMGMLHLYEFPLLFLGAYVFLTGRFEHKKIFVWWFLTAPLAASLTKATPHAVRSLLFLPSFQILTATGIYSVFQITGIFRKFRGESLAVFFTLAAAANIVYYLHQYWIHTPVEAASEWQYGYKQLVEEFERLPQGKKAIVTYKYDQPYIYFLFYRKTDPAWYQQEWGKNEIFRDIRSFGRFEFRKLDWANDEKMQDVILAGTPGEIPPTAANIVSEIKYPDGSTAFRIVDK